MKSIHKEKLLTDLEKYCIQMGILPTEIPKLIFNRNEYLEIISKHGHSKRRSKTNLGYCEWSTRTILVDGNRKRNYVQYRHTLVHELVHFRFPHLKHGNKFDRAIKEVLRGRIFHAKHIHFFAAYAQKHTLLISDYTNEEIEILQQKYDKINKTRQKTWEKQTRYWAVYAEAKMWALVIKRESDRDWQLEQLDRTQYTSFGGTEESTTEVERILNLIKLIVRDQ